MHGSNLFIFTFREYCKRIDKDLPFYYWTSNERFRDLDKTMPSFNDVDEIPDEVDPKDYPLRLHRLAVNRREDSSIFTAGRCFLPACNHRPVVEPPLLEPQIEGLEDLMEDDAMDLMEDVV